ncbi:transmembrane efflux protein [Dactylonectria macrodidyma]|uniref:Transmembrane efflux protein n=1 Tax=Dactylonectria macrodidyma TaxID=307937 RepID=A0A9P9DSF9_9HYPO|nr:transmembrane efflux protein [Dactylonectria macrodidyma]
MILGMIYYSMMALLPQGSLYLFTNDQIEIGLMALPNGCVQAVFGVIGPALIGKIKRLRLQIIFTLVLQKAFTAALAGAVDNKTAWMAIQAFCVGPFVLVVLACYVVAGLNMPLRYLGLASGLIGTFRSMGGSVGNAVFSTILQGVIRRDLGPEIASAALKTGFDPADLDSLIPATFNAILGIPGAFAAVPGTNPTVEAAAIEAFRKVYGRAFSMVFYATIPFGVIVIILAFFINDLSVYLTNHTAVHMQKEVMNGKGSGQVR